MQEEDYVEQEQVSQQINIEESSGSNDGSLPTPNTSTPPNNEPPPMTNGSGEPVIINTTTIRVGTDYFKPKSEVEVDDLVEQQRINLLQKKIFKLQYEANYGSLPKELLQEENSTENTSQTTDQENIIPDSILPKSNPIEEKTSQENIIPSSILPKSNPTEEKEEDKIINLKELAGEDYQPTVNNSEEGTLQKMPLPTQVIAPVEEAPLIDLAQLATDEETSDSEETAPIVKAPLPTPETDSNFQAVSEKIALQGEKTQKHESSRRATQKAENASVEPQNKKRSLAEVKQVDKIESKETPTFDTSSFVDMLMAKIIAITPKSEEEADEFKDNNKVHEVKSVTSGQIQQKKTTSVGPLESATKETPKESGIQSKVVTPLGKAPIGPKPKDLGIEQGMPKKKTTEEVEQPIQQNSQELEQQFKENEITDEQLSKSNEPAFMNALETKNTAQEDSKNAPQQLRTEEDQSLLATKSGAKQQGKEDLLSMHQDRANVLTNVQGEQENASSSYTAEEASVATKINGIYQSTKTEVEGILSRLDSRVSQLFDQGAAQAQQRFESYIAKEMAAYKAERYEGAVVGSITWMYDAMAGLPDEVNLFFVKGRHLYIETMQQTIQAIADLVAQELTTAKQRVQAGRQEVADYVESLPDNLKKVGRKTAAAINRDFDELNSKVDAKQEELINSLAQKYVENVAAVDSRIEEMKAANRGLVDIALDSVSGVIGTILEVKNALIGILSAAVEAIGAIIMDPIGFLSNLISGVGQGISNFMTKIDDYLTTGFVEWLTGAMSGAGIEMPEDIFSLEGIFSITTQALGMTWDFIRDRAVGVLGEKAVGTIEESFEVFQVLRTEGMGGAWEYLKEQFGDLQETIMGSITGMLISEVVEAGVKYLLALLTPAGAFVKAAMMIVDIAEFFIRQGSQLMELVDAFVQSISAISTGAVGKVAEMIERALSLSVPLLIGMFTSLLGLGDLAEKVQKIFKKIKGKITGAIDGFIEKAGAWFKDKKGRRKERKDKKKKEKEDKANKNKSEEDKDKESKDDKDKRTDKKKKSDLKQGMKLGATVVNNEQLNQDQIKVELNKLELKYRLDDLGAKLLQETSEWHVFMLNARLNGLPEKHKEIKRKPTKAENEEQVSEEDRKLHERIAAEVKAQLEAKGKSTEGVETFEEFYTLLQSEAVMLQKKYQPQLRKGIKIAVDLVNSVKEDAKDGDVDVKVRIAPNTIDAPFSINWGVDKTTVLTAAEEAKIKNLTGGADVLALIANAKSDINKYISLIKEIRVMISLPVDAIFVGGNIRKDNNSIFFERSLNPATAIPKFGEIDIFVDNTLIEVKSDWGSRKDISSKLAAQFLRYRNMKDGKPPIYLNGSQINILKTILQIEATNISAKILNTIKRSKHFDEIRLGNGTIISIDNLNKIKPKNTKGQFVNSEAQYNAI